MLVYFIEISIGQWEDKYDFIYKELYFTSLDQAERVKAILDTINQVWVDIILDDKFKDSGTEGFKPLINLDNRFAYGGWYEVPSISIFKKHITII